MGARFLLGVMKYSGITSWRRLHNLVAPDTLRCRLAHGEFYGM